MEQGRIFISYSRANSNFVVRLARDLKVAGHNIWLDQFDIPPGARWDDELERALEACEIFIVILTPFSMASENVKDEIGYAIDARKRILPVLLENATLPLRLRRFQYVDFTSKSYEDGLESANRILSSLSAGQTSPVVNIPAGSSAGNSIAKNDPSPAVHKAQSKIRHSPQKRVEPAPSTQRRMGTPLIIPVGFGLLVFIAIGILFFSKFNSLASAADMPTPSKAPTTVSTVVPAKTPILFAQWMDVSLSDLGYVADDDIGGRFRASDDYSQKIGFAVGFPNFYSDNATLQYGTILLTESAIVWRDVSVSELRNTPQSDVPELFRAVHDYATSHGFVGGFPDFYVDNVKKVYGLNFIRQGAGEWRDVPIRDLGNPALNDVPSMFRAVHDYATSHGFVGGFPDFYVDDVKNVYGVILIKATP